jgi:hypothetical protein
MNKEFDCVEMKRRGAEHVRELTKGMTREQLIEFWEQRNREFEERLRRAREAQEQKRSA